MPYVIGQSTATLEIHDGENGIVNTSYLLEWEDEDDWKGAPSSDTVWDDMPHQWLPDIPCEIMDDVHSVIWMKRPHDQPLQAWEDFSLGTVGAPAQDLPGVGHWDIKFRAEYGTRSWFVSLADDFFVSGVQTVKWERGHSDQEFRTMGNESEVFPEQHRTDGYPSFHPDQSEVRLIVTLKAPVPAGKQSVVKLKVFDPDHEHQPTRATDDFDPNDIWGGDGITIIAGDNRQTLGGIGDLGGTLSVATLTFGAGESEKEATFTIDDPQPGNNFIGVACPVRPGETANGVDLARFGEDGVQ